MRILKNIFIPLLASSLVLAALPAAAVVGSWSTPVDLSATGEDAYDAQITVSSTGLATAIWSRYDGNYDIIQSSHILTPTPSQPTSTPTTAPAASLAKTGADVDWLFLGSLIAVVAGAGFLTFSRRKRTQ